MADIPSGYHQLDSGLLIPEGLRASEVSGLTNPAAWLVDWFGGARSTAGIAVNPQSAMTLPTYYACIRAIAEDVGKLPLLVYERLPRGKRRAVEHPLYDVLHTAFNEDMSACTAKETMTHHAVAWGDGYGAIGRDMDGTAQDIYPIHPSRVRVRRNQDTRRIEYEVWHGSSTITDEPYGTIPAADMLHIHGLGSDGLRGYSPVALAAESLGLSLAAQRYGASFFGNSARPAGILMHPGKLSDTGKKGLVETWRQLHSRENAQGIGVLEEGMKFEALDIPPEEAQFLETRKFQRTEVCAMFRIPPHKIGDLEFAHYNNVEQLNLEYVIDTLTPWAVRWEQELKRKLFWRTPYFAEILFSGLLRGDQAARANYYKSLFNMAALSPNDIRELENANPYDGGDQYFMQLNMSTVPRIVAGENMAKSAAPPLSPPEDEGQEDAREAGEREEAEVSAGLSLGELAAAIHRNGHGGPAHE